METVSDSVVGGHFLTSPICPEMQSHFFIFVTDEKFHQVFFLNKCKSDLSVEFYEELLYGMMLILFLKLLK